MKQAASMDEVRRLALAIGAEVELDGEVFNSARVRMQPKTVVPPDPVASAAQVGPPSEPAITRAQIDQLLQERDAFWRSEMLRMLSELTQAMATRQEVQAPRTAWTFTPSYSRGQVLERIVAEPLKPMVS